MSALLIPSASAPVALPAQTRAEPTGVEGELDLIEVELESGDIIDAVVRYRLDGVMNAARSNVVLAIHALTGSQRTLDWWPEVVTSGGALDPVRYAVLGANVLGGCNGTQVRRRRGTGPVAISTRDQAHILGRLLDALGVARPRLVVGGSLGGMIALEFAATFPERLQQVVCIAAPGRQTALGFAWNAIMREAIVAGGPERGFALARMVGMLSYRTPDELERRFAGRRVETGTPLVGEWLSRHGDKLVRRFDPVSYLQLIDAMDRHDVGRGRGGLSAALAPIADKLTGVGIPGDLLYPSSVVQHWCFAAGAPYRVIASDRGHDAFLLESDQVNRILRDVLQD